MEQVNLRSEARLNAGLEQLRRGLGTVPAGDPFMAIFQSMMEQMTENGGEGLLQDGDPEQLEGAMAELLAAMGTADGGDAEQQARAMMSELAGMALIQPVMRPGQPGAVVQAAGVSGVSDAAARREGAATQLFAESGAAQTEQAAAGDEQVRVLETSYVEQPSGRQTDSAAQDYQAEGRFRSAVQAAKRQLEQPTAENSAAGRQDLAATEGAKHTDFTETLRENRETGEAPPLSRQLDEGLSREMALGRKEFSMKLKPESLGEITVKLTEAEGKTTLSILTASTGTAKAINHELAALREAMRPMGVEVQQAVPKAAENAGAQAQSQQFDMARQFAQQFGGQRQSFHGQNQNVFYGEKAARDDPMQLFSAPALIRAGLDTYI